MHSCEALQAARPEMETLMKWMKEQQQTAGDKASIQMHI